MSWSNCNNIISLGINKLFWFHLHCKLICWDSDAMWNEVFFMLTWLKYLNWVSLLKCLLPRTVQNWLCLSFREYIYVILVTIDCRAMQRQIWQGDVWVTILWQFFCFFSLVKNTSNNLLTKNCFYFYFCIEVQLCPFII